MDPLTLSLASTGIGIGSSILGGALGFDQADQQRKETQEQIRRFTMQKNRTISSAQAEGAASGITADSGSLTKYLSDMNLEFNRQTDWMKQAGDARASGTEASTLFKGLSSFGSSIFGFGQANNWFRSPTIG